MHCCVHFGPRVDDCQCEEVYPAIFSEQEVDFPFEVANSTAMSIALPILQKEMKLEPARVQWVISAYSLTSVSKLILVRRAYGSCSP